MHIDDIKPFFETGDFPTQAQFYQLFDCLRFNDQEIVIADLAQEVLDLLRVNRPERKVITGDTTIDIPAEYRLVNISIKNPSAFDLVFIADYPATGPGETWLTMEVPANSEVDFNINKTFWVATSISLVEETGVDFSATPVILLIDRK